MNLHIFPDSVFAKAFYRNLQSFYLTENNQVVINKENAKHIEDGIVFAPVNSSKFSQIIKSTYHYDAVFIHYFTPAIYRWVAKNNFKKLCWCVWGGDIYNLPWGKNNNFEPITSSIFKKSYSWQETIFTLKVSFFYAFYKTKAWLKVNEVYTWMEEEFIFTKSCFAKQATHTFFYYEGEVPYDSDLVINKNYKTEAYIILGNSGSPQNNHADILYFLNEIHFKKKIVIPVSYGNKEYISRLKSHTKKYSNLTIQWVEEFMPIEQYNNLLANADAFIMYALRPQGMGNVFAIMNMGVPVYLNPKSAAYQALVSIGFNCYKAEDLAKEIIHQPEKNKALIKLKFGHNQTKKIYRDLFT
jgi:dTDP-N-acetylfucosamine:lipid II N-acetylfucosaminyltransferase